MKVRGLIKELLDYNLDADISVIAHCKEEEFTLTFGGGGEGETKDDCSVVNFYVDSLCTNEK